MTTMWELPGGANAPGVSRKEDLRSYSAFFLKVWGQSISSHSTKHSYLCPEGWSLCLTVLVNHAIGWVFLFVLTRKAWTQLGTHCAICMNLSHAHFLLGLIPNFIAIVYHLISLFLWILSPSYTFIISRTVLNSEYGKTWISEVLSFCSFLLLLFPF